MDSSSSTGLLNTILHPLIRRRKRKLLITSATQLQVALVGVDNDICCFSCDLHVHLTLISGSELSTTVQSYNPVGTTHEIAPLAVADGNIVTPLKIQVPYNHRVVGTFSNPGSNGGTYDIYGLLETYKSDS